MRHTITCLVENQSGVLARIAGLFAGRGYNIDSLCVAETMDSTSSRMTIVARGDDHVLEQVKKQLNKIVDVVKVTDLTEEEHVERELMLIKVDASKSNRTQIMQICEIFRARIVDVTAKSFLIEATGNGKKLDAIVQLLNPFGIRDFARTGKIGMQRGI